MMRSPQSPDSHGEQVGPSRGMGFCLGEIGNKGTRTGFLLGEMSPPFLALGVTVSRYLQESECSDVMIDSYDCHGNAERVWTISTEDASD